MKSSPTIYLIGGSNGAGKTTFAMEFFPGYVGRVTFINADLIAQGLRRRFTRTLRNFFHVYYDLVDYVLLLDNSGPRPRTIMEKRARRLRIEDIKLFNAIRGEAGPR